MTLFFSQYFIFSSRRRHTRWPRDWSSDVCSSDLGRQWPVGQCPGFGSDRGARRRGGGAPGCGGRGDRDRSEERRGGKGCRGRVWRALCGERDKGNEIVSCLRKTVIAEGN